jgi:uncharacterized protein (TIGR03437 family)
MRRLCAISFLAAAPLLANLPSWDTSGNSLLNGTWYFREIFYVVDNSGTGNLSQGLAAYGTVSFNGSGGYTIPNGTVISAGSGSSTFSFNGSYSLAGNGYGFFTNPLSSSSGTYTDYGLVANNILIASATENGFNSLLIATPVTSPLATVSAFQGNYKINGFIPGSRTSASDVTFQLNPDGAGNLGSVSMTGYFAGGGTNVFTQNSSSVKYTFQNGAGVITFPTSNSANFYSGQEYVYISPDHNFVFGGSPGYPDMFVGVKTTTGSVNFNGLYYEGGIDEDASNLVSSGYSAIDTFYGSFNATNGVIVGHERLFTPLLNSVAEGFSYANTFPSSISNGGYTDSSNTTQYTFTNGGAIRIGFGVAPFLGINLAVQAPPLSGSGVYLNPSGVANAASFSTFTAGVSPGEFIVLYGSGFTSGTQVASKLPFPTSLGNVTVTINGIQAPIYYVSPTQISVIVPYGITYTPAAGTLPIATIQVNSGGTLSNIITQFINQTTPGIFTVSANGIGYGAIEHGLTGQVVNPTNPAQPGETVAVFMSGLGATLPSVTEGTAGPTNPLANTTATIAAYVNGIQANVAYAGLAPSLAGVYQVNLTIPSNATSGDNVVEILGPDSDNYQALISIGTGSASSSAVSSAARPNVRGFRAHNAARPVTPSYRAEPCFTGSACAATR